MCIIRCFYFIVVFAFPLTCFAEEVPCSVNISTQYQLGGWSKANVGVNISATNNLKIPIDGITWSMQSKSGTLLFTETWVGANQRMNFNMNPKSVGIVQIGPGDTTALVTTAPEDHMEFYIRDNPNSDPDEMRLMFEKRLSEAKEKYKEVSCNILGFVKKIVY